MDTKTRIWLDGSLPNDDKDSRDPFVRDADIVLYSSAFRRLKGVTQVLPIVSGTPRVHDRMIHSLKVAQVGRSIAEKLVSKHPEYREEVLLPNAVYVAGIAHDLGHPPFGHIAERELQRILAEGKYKLGDSFEGNAQTFRILTRLSQKTGNPETGELRCGMGLTAGSLVSVLKYPWPKGESREQLHRFGRSWEDSKRNYYNQKWGVYSDDLDPFLAISKDLLENCPELIMNSQIVDLADDITYAVHDVQDHYRSGQTPLESLSLGNDEFRAYATSLILSREELDCDDITIKNAWSWINELPLPDERYVDSRQARASLHHFESSAVSQIIESIYIDSTENSIRLPEHLRIAVEILKQLTWYYVIDNPALSASQLGQTRIVHDLHAWLCEWYASCVGDSQGNFAKQEQQRKARKLPQRLRDYYEDTKQSVIARDLEPVQDGEGGGLLGATAEDREMNVELKRSRGRKMSQDERISRAVVDYIASLTDDEAIILHNNLGSYGSVSPVAWL